MNNIFLSNSFFSFISPRFFLGHFKFHSPDKWSSARRSHFHSSTIRRDNSDPYQILGVSRNSSDQDIKKAFLKKAKEYHPDVNKSPGASKQFLKFKQAYEKIKDSKSRSAYSFESRFGSGFGSSGPSGFNTSQGQSSDFGYGPFHFYYTNTSSRGSSNPHKSYSHDPFEELFSSFVQGMNFGQWSNEKHQTTKINIKFPDRMEIISGDTKNESNLFSLETFQLYDPNKHEFIAQISKLINNQTLLTTLRGEEIGNSQIISSIGKINLASPPLSLTSIIRTIIPFFFQTIDISVNDYNIMGFRISIFGLFVWFSSWQRKLVDNPKNAQQPTTTRRHIATVFKIPTTHWKVYFNSQVNDTDRALTLLQISTFVLPKVTFFRSIVKNFIR